MTDKAESLLLSSLKDLRMQAGLTQAQLAQKLGIAQSEISRVEKRDDYHVGTLKRYVEDGLGGELEVWVVLPGIGDSPETRFRLA